MIVIEAPQMEKKNGRVRLYSDISISEEAYQKWIFVMKNRERYKGYEKMYQYQAGTFRMWYEVEEQYEEYLCAERGDAFALAVLYFAMVTGEDIESRAVLSNEFCHNLNYYLIPLHCNARTGYRKIQVYGKTETADIALGRENATGISCGVDSFDTVLTYLDKEMDDTHKLSLLTVFNAGAFYNMPDMKRCMKGEMSISEWNEKARQYFEEESERGRQVAEKLGLQFLTVDSNISDLYQGGFMESHAYRNCSAVLALQKLFANYYYASAGESELASAKLENDATYNVHLFSTNTTKFYLGGIERTRIEKLQHIGQSEIVQEHLHVCCDETYNCGRCGKCFRTLIILDVIGMLDLFKASFKDLSAYEKKGWKKYVWVLDKKSSDKFADDIYEYMKKNQIPIPLIARLYHYTLPVRKLIRKL